MNNIGGKYLTFSLGDEHYGIFLEKVKEIIGMHDITEVPKTPHFIKGVINLRGKIITIMDLRMKFEMEFKDYNDRTCIIVVELENSSKKKIMGITVDKVSEVIDIKEENIEGINESEMQIDGEFIIGIGKTKSKVIMLLDIEKILNFKELKEIEKLSNISV